MARDKARDDKLFNCSEKHENGYVAGLYGSNKDEVSIFLTKNCDNNTIKNSTHQQVYKLIKEKLGYELPN
jgi:hypothetical protein